MRLRVFRVGAPVLWLVTFISVISLYFYFIYTTTELNNFMKFQIKFRNPIVIQNPFADKEIVNDIWESTEKEEKAPPQYDLPEIDENKENILEIKPDFESSSESDKIENILESKPDFDSSPESDKNNDILMVIKPDIPSEIDENDNLLEIQTDLQQCRTFNEAEADMKTIDLYQSFEFNASWIKNKGIWEDFYENRWLEQKKNSSRLPLHVVVMPHSHNDPGWHETFEEYFGIFTRSILNSAVQNLPNLPEMTFLWTEISFLAMWFESATEDQKNTFKKLVNEGRIEITTGGYVMTDEAAAHIYPMVDQLIEGHQWVQKNLNVTPTHGWSIDPFGHGSTVPYLLSSCDFDGAIIQRLHYNWKEYFARHQRGDFVWKPQWDASNAKDRSLLMHNLPWDMYFPDSACGPDKSACAPFDFRWFPSIPNIQQAADNLIGQYERSASLYSHNTFLAIVGGDFRYSSPSEWTSQYNYKKIIDYVNANPERYNNAKMAFGTPKDYFKVIRERTQNNFPTLSGDLFPYSDIYSDGFPSYWTGYFTTRPFVKIMARDLEHQLRNAEILFTLAYNKMNNGKSDEALKDLKGSYQRLITARRNLALFQHHDAITGTSKARVMKNYLERMFNSINDVIQIQQHGIEILTQKSTTNLQKNFIIDSIDRTNSSVIPLEKRFEFTATKDTFEFKLFNSLAQDRVEMAAVRVSKPHVRVADADGNRVSHQVNYFFTINENGEVTKKEDEFEVIFVAQLPALSIATFSVTYIENEANESIETFEVLDVADGSEIFIQNTQMRLNVDRGTGLLKSMTLVEDLQIIPLEIKFGAYTSVPKRSGAYLFQTDPLKPETNIFESDKPSKIIVTEGPLASYVTVMYGDLLQHTIQLLNSQTHLDNAIFISNHVNIEERHSNAEMYMRIKSSIKNGNEFFTDLNGFQWMRRKKSSKIGIEGNYYPITSSIFIQDKDLRATLITSHAQGASSANEGEMEVMLDKRTPTDDDRGMEEGVKDLVPTLQKFWLTIEHLSGTKGDPKKFIVPSFHVHHLTNVLNYPVSIFLNQAAQGLEVHRKLSLLKKPLPCDLNLFNLRTLNDANQSTLPSRSALLIVHKLSYDCDIGVHDNLFYSKMCLDNADNFDSIDLFDGIKIQQVQSTSLTALKSHGSISSFKSSSIEAMDLKTFNLTFVE